MLWPVMFGLARISPHDFTVSSDTGFISNSISDTGGETIALDAIAIVLRSGRALLTQSLGFALPVSTHTEQCVQHPGHWLRAWARWIVERWEGFPRDVVRRCKWAFDTHSDDAHSQSPCCRTVITVFGWRWTLLLGVDRHMFVKKVTISCLGGPYSSFHRSGKQLWWRGG